MANTLIRVFLVLTFVGLSGCETFRGMGRDLTNVGDALMGN